MASHMDVDVPSVQYIAEEPASLRADDHNNAQDDDSSSEEENDMDAGETALGPSLSKEEINGLKEQVQTNPYDYEAHVRYIAALRQAFDFEELTAAREQMSTLFPLSPELWMEWIQDESRLASTVEEKQRIMDLHSRAVKDYLSAELWRSYVAFVTHEYTNSMDEDAEQVWLTLDIVRSVCEQAKHATEYHFTEGHIVYNAYGGFETALCKQARSQEQVVHVREMYLNRLKVPHARLEDTFSNYSGFETEVDSANYESHMKAATAIVSKTQPGVNLREPFEQQLRDSAQSLDAFLQYIAFEKSQPQGGDVHRIRTLYERAITVHCLNPTLWDIYIVDMMDSFKVEPVLLPITERSTRNCNWSADLWAHYMRAMERFGRSKEEIEAIYQRGLSFLSVTANMEEILKLMQAICHFYQRRVDWATATLSEGVAEEMLTKYKDSIAYISEGFAPGDPYLRLERALLRIQTRKLNDFNAARALYADICKRFPQQSEAWLEYTEFERQYGTIEQARALYKKSILRTTDWPERLLEAFLNFEKEDGTVETYYEAALLVEKVLIKARQKEAKKAGTAASLGEQTVGMNAAMDQDGTKKGKKREHGKQADAFPEPHAKRRKHEEGHNAGKREKMEGAQKANLYEYHEIDNKCAGNMLYITNLSPRVDEKRLRDLFSEDGEIIDLILQPNESTGELEAYLEFATAVQVRQGAQKTGTLIDDIPIKVVRCKPTDRIWDFTLTEEKNKIYVKNLPREVGKPALRQAFSKFGKIRDIRLVLRTTIAFAFIEFENEESATHSLALNDTELIRGSGRKMSVAISDPSKTKHKEVDEKELFVSNLPLTFQKEDVDMLFRQFGNVKAVRLPLRDDGNPKGIAFVEFDDVDAAKQGLSLNGTMVEGCVIVVSHADPNRRTKSWETRRGRGRDAGGANRGANRGGGGGSRGGAKAALGYKGPKKESNVSKDADKAAAPAPAPVTHSGTSMTSFIPRAAAARKSVLGKPHVPRKTAAQASMDVDGNGEGASGAAPATRTQDDFRSMLLGNK